jgi:arylsulfatase A-like enzyme
VDAPERYKELYNGVQFHGEPAKHESRLRMAAMVSQLDAKIGEFVHALERTGQRERTLIVFTSDNGGIESLENAYVGKVPHSPLNSENDPLRGQKRTLYEGGIRVCAFANWPGTLRPGKVNAPMYVGDWLPTVAALVGAKTQGDPGWDGLDRWEVLTGKVESPAPRTIYIAHPEGQALLHGDWKIVRHKKGAPEVFDLGKDPYEKRNLALVVPDKLKELSTLLDAQVVKDSPVVPADLAGLPH